MSSVDFTQSRRALNEVRGFLKTLRNLQTFGEQISALEDLEGLAKAAEGRIAEAEARVVNATTAADAAEAEASQRITAAQGSVADAEARAEATIEAAKRRTADAVTTAEQVAAEAIAQVQARREKAAAEAAAIKDRLVALQDQVAAAVQQRDAIRERIETLRSSFAA